MGALTSAVTALGKITSTIGAFEGARDAITGFSLSGQEAASNARRNDLRANQDLALKQLREKQAIQQQDMAEQAALDRAKMTADTQAAEMQRRNALKRAVARQRASFGSQGIASGDGSSEAVLLGLFEESDQDRADRDRLDTLRSNAIDQNIFSQKRVNVLQRSQLEEKQNLARLFSEG